MILEDIELTYVLPIYQENIESNDLEKLVDIYGEYGKDVLNKIHFIFIDDCSPIPIIIKNKKINYTLLRITDDIVWNQGGARNLGVTVAHSVKLILTDLDHIFPESVFKDLIFRKTPSEIYKFRREFNGKRIDSHPNTFFCSKATYFKSLGVDEEFSGNYGSEDIYFYDLQRHLGTKFKKYRKIMITTFEHKHHNLTRDTAHNLKLLEVRRKAISENKPFSAHSRKFLNFKWEVIESNSII
ncbi:MAG: hypothetical protein ABI207_00310 [Crocinitomicaceae bacterium]